MTNEVRSVAIRISANVAGAVAGLRQLGTQAEQSEKQITRAGQRGGQALDKLGSMGGKVALGGAAVLGVMERTNLLFDKQMSAVEAATTAKGAQLDSLRAAAVKAGADTAFSATEAAKGITELAKAGQSTQDILSGGLKGALDLAAAGELDVASAAEFMATALTQFHLKGTKATHVADLLAAGAGKAQGSVQDMALALSYVGVPAAQAGVSIEETAGTIALLAKNGIIGERAGTSLRGMLGSLTGPTKQASDTMKKYSIDVFDAHGKFVGFDGAAQQLRDHLGGLSEQERLAALNRIFGNEQMQAAMTLYDSGAKGVDEWTKKVNDSGYAAKTAATKTDNLAGDLERLKGSVDSLFLGEGGGFQDGLRGIVQGTEKLVDKFSELPDSVQGGVVKALALATAVGGALFAASKIVKTFREIRDITGGGKLGKGGGLGGAAAKATGVVPVFVTNWGGGGSLPGGDKFGGGKGAGGKGGGKVPTTFLGASPYLLPLLTAGDHNPKQDTLHMTKEQIKASDRQTAAMKAFFKATNTNQFGESKNGTAGQVLAAMIRRDPKAGIAVRDQIAKTQGVAPGKSVADTSQVKKAIEQYNAQKSLNQMLFQGVDATGKLAAKQEALQLASTKSSSGLNHILAPLGQYKAQIASLPKGVQTEIKAHGVPKTQGEITALQKKYKLTPAQVKTLAKLLDETAPTRRKVVKSVNGLNNVVGKPKVRLDEGNTVSRAKTLWGTLSGIFGTITQHVKIVGGKAGLPSAKGNIFGSVRAFAYGDVANNHQPELAGPGVTRIWREEETGGEAYVPLANDHRRPRAKAILGQTAAIMGGLVTWHATGSTTALPRGAALTQIKVGTYGPFTVTTLDVANARKIAVLAKQSAREQRLEDYRAQQSIRDLQRQLAEKQKGKYVLRGLDRKIAIEELAAAKAALSEIRTQTLAIAQAKSETATSLSGQLDIFARGTSARGAVASVDAMINDISAYGQTAAQLKAAGASPALLAMIASKAESGDFRSATRLGKALLASPAALGQLNASLSTLGQVSAQTANVTADPRFLAAGKWNPTAMAPTASKRVDVNLNADPNAWLAELTRVVKHEVQSAMAGGL